MTAKTSREIAPHRPTHVDAAKTNRYVVSPNLLLVEASGFDHRRALGPSRFDFDRLFWLVVV